MPENRFWKDFKEKFTHLSKQIYVNNIKIFCFTVIYALHKSVKFQLNTWATFYMKSRVYSNFAEQKQHNMKSEIKTENSIP